jgi:hypothetical protein
VLVTLASGASGACCEPLSLRALAALCSLADKAGPAREKAGPTRAQALLVRCGALDCAWLAPHFFPSSLEVAALSCHLSASMLLSAPALLRLHLPRCAAVDRTLAAALCALQSWPDSERVVSSALGAIWAAMLAKGAAAQAVALRCHAVPLALQAMARHAGSEDVVRCAAACLMLLCTRPTCAASERVLGDGWGAALRAAEEVVWGERDAVVRAMARHGGLGALLEGGCGAGVLPPWSRRRGAEEETRDRR